VAYPEKILAEDEQVVAHLHPHWITLVPAVFWFIVICAAAGAGIAFLPDGGAHGPLLIAIIVVAVVLLSWLTMGPVITWRTSHYIFTTHRVLIRRGIFTHTGRDIALQRISDVAFSQTLWDRIVRAGTLTIESAGEHGQETLVNVPNSERQQQLLNRLIEEDHDRRAREAYEHHPMFNQQQQQQYPPPYPPQEGPYEQR
jgi:uncharacterized membrane protein YdbT with pleckstrin-like domain